MPSLVRHYDMVSHHTLPIRLLLLIPTVCQQTRRFRLKVSPCLERTTRVLTYRAVWGGSLRNWLLQRAPLWVIPDLVHWLNFLTSSLGAKG